MRHVDVKEKVAELVEAAPDWPAFVRLGDLTKLRYNADGTFQRPNFESGPLLHALVRHFRPQTVLEIGTGRGFGAISLAMGLRDAGIPGRVVTLDVLPHDQPQQWAIDDGRGPRVDSLSRREVWESHVDTALRSRIECRCGDSTTLLDQLIADPSFRADLVYVDADHDWPGVRHDYLASLLVAARPFRILFDDYQPASDLYGVRRLVDDEIARDFDLEAIHTDGRWHDGANAAAPLAESTYAQILLDSEKLRGAPDRVLDSRRVAKRLGRHRRFGSLVDLAWRVSRRIERTV